MLDALALTEAPPACAEGGSNSLQRWTRSQRIRTAAAIPLAVPVVDAGSVPAHLAIATRAAHLRELGMSDRRIALALGVSDKTVAKSLRRAAKSNGAGTSTERNGGHEQGRCQRAPSCGGRGALP
jgi:hypothetical protein